MHSRLLSALGMTTLLSSLSLVACGDSGSGPGKNPPVKPDPPASTVPARLIKAQTCDELEALLKGDAKKKLADGIDEQIKAIRDYGGYWGYGYRGDFGDSPVVGAPGAAGGGGVADGGGGAGGGAPAPPATPTDGNPGGENSGDDNGDGGGGEGPSYSDTNTQVKGVDEADFVETDGTNVYVLHGSKFLTLGAQPNAPSLAQEVAIDGVPREMFVARDGEQGPRRAVIYSDVEGSAVYAAAGVTPKPTYYDYGYGGGIGGRLGGGFFGGVGAPGGGPVIDIAVTDVGPGPGTYVPLTKVTVLDLENGPTKISEVYFEGSYSTARRVGGVVRTVLNGGQHGPAVKQFPAFDQQTPPPAPQNVEAWVAAFEQLRAEGLAAIDASDVTDWLPYVFVKTAAGVEAQNLACDSYHVPMAGTTEYGLTQIQSFDLRAPTDVKGTAIVGRADVIYSNADSLYVAAHGWNPLPSPPVVSPPSFPSPLPGGGTAGGFGSGGGDVAEGGAGGEGGGSAGSGEGGTG
ncbi:MAG TPA: beta-propeller domain-containing protein, partial [Polyangiaceae bacterium]|nr:beta-propeller domain-containing protein [Polyangiaceae bacterium]